MDILKIELKHSTLLLFIALAMLVSPSTIQKIRVVTFQKILTIQTSKMDPPRLAFDEVYFNENIQFNDWDLLGSREGTNLNLNATELKLQPRKIVLQTMTVKQEEIEKSIQERAWVQELSQRGQRRIEIAQEKFGTLDEDWSSPSLKEVVAQKIAKAQAEFLSERPVSPVTVKADPMKNSDVVPKNDPSRHLLGGVIEVKGLPSGSSQWSIQVARFENDVKKEDGHVDLKRSTFKLDAADLSGTLVAQMIDTNSGLVMGEGRMRVSQYAANQLKGKAKLTIEKATDEIASNWQTFYRNPANLMPRSVRGKPISTRVLFASLNVEGETDKAGTFHFEQIKKGSWGILRTEAKDYQAGLYLVQSGNEKQLPMFPVSMMKALKEIVKEQALFSEVAETGSVVWGQVTQDGKPFAGATVNVEFLENYRPVYFNSLLLPDPQLKATSENGYFAILHLPPGFHSLVASLGEIYHSHANVIVDQDTTSIALLENTLQTEKSEVKVFDAFTGNPSVARLELQGLPASLTVQGYADIHLSPINRLSLMKVVPQDSIYAESLQLYEDSSDSIHVPLIRNDWVESIRGSKKINTEPSTGSIVGFVPSGSFEVYLGHEAEFPAENIIYFDAQGNTVPMGVPGGGFIIFNAPLGTQSVVIADIQTGLLQMQVAPVDESSLVVMKFR